MTITAGGYRPTPILASSAAKASGGGLIENIGTQVLDRHPVIPGDKGGRYLEAGSH